MVEHWEKKVPTPPSQQGPLDGGPNCVRKDIRRKNTFQTIPCSKRFAVATPEGRSRNASHHQHAAAVISV